MSRFGTTFKKLRMKQNKTQTELARALGIARSTVSMYEQGEREPDLNTLEKIADYFQVDMNAILGHEASFNDTDASCSDFETLKKLLAQDRAALSAEQKQELIRTLLS